MLHIDFETRSAIDLRKTGADVYARHPSTNAWCMAYAIDKQPVDIWKMGEPLPLEVFMAIKDGEEVVAHNAPFELAIWNHVMAPRYKWPLLFPTRVRCTMAQCYAMSLPGALEAAGAAVGLTAQKDMKGSRVMLQLSKPRDIVDGRPIWYTPESHPEKFETLYSYCKTDVEVERELDSRLLKLSPEEREVWLLDYEINQRGVEIDLKSARVARDIVEQEAESLDDQMREVTKNKVGSCNAHIQVKNWLNERGFKVDSVDKAAVVTLLERQDLPPDIRRALTIRQEAAKSSTAKLEAMLLGTCDDGRSRGLFQYHGAGTGRWAGRRIQLHNLPKNKLPQKDIEKIFKVLSDAG